MAARRRAVGLTLGRHRDLQKVGDWQRAQPTTEALVIAGDVNASQAHRRSRLGAHWPQGRRVPPFAQLDHVLERGMGVVDAGTVEVAGTDHAAVWAWVAMP